MNEFLNKISWFLLGVAAAIVVAVVFVNKHFTVSNDGEKIIINDSIVVMRASDTSNIFDGATLVTVSVEDDTIADSNVTAAELAELVMGKAAPIIKSYAAKEVPSNWDIEKMSDILIPVYQEFLEDIFNRYSPRTRQKMAEFYADQDMTEDILSIDYISIVEEFELRIKNDTVLIQSLMDCDTDAE